MARILDLARGAETSAMARACAVAILRANPDDRSALLLAGVHSLDLGEPETATALFERGLALADPADRGVFLMPVWCAPDSILRQLATAPPGQLDSLNAAYWDSRDPTPLTPANENRLEYWKRLVLADLFFGDPEKRLRGWETPRGELLVRYGPPEALTFSKAAFEEGEAMQQGDAGLARRRTKSLKEATKPSTISMLHPTQTWAYSFGGRPVEFSFVDPTLHDRFIPENPSEFDALVKQAPAVLADGDHGSLRNCYVGSSGTRADGGRTRQAIVVGLPAGAAGDPWAGAEVAFRVLDPGGRVVTSELRTIAPGSATSLAAGSRANLVLTETPLAAGRYTTEVRITAGTREGTFAVPADVRDFGRDSLEVSDLQLGFPPAGEGAGGAASMIRNPTRLVPRGNPVVIAFEVYNLQPGSGEVARYRVRYTLLPIAYAREYARLLASGNAASDPALQFGQLGRALGGVTLDERNYSDVLFPQVDVPLAPAARVRLAFRLETAGLRDGDYALVVTTTDLVANRAVSVRSPFTLLPEAGFRSALAAD
jgi:GWxTD domain-containing protein